MLVMFAGILLYKFNSMSVMGSVCLFKCLFPSSYKTANPNELKFWEMIPIGMQNV